MECGCVRIADRDGLEIAHVLGLWPVAKSVSNVETTKRLLDGARAQCGEVRLPLSSPSPPSHKWHGCVLRCQGKQGSVLRCKERLTS